MPHLTEHHSASRNSKAPSATVTVGRIMPRKPVTVSMDDTLAKAQALFAGLTAGIGRPHPVVMEHLSYRPKQAGMP